MRRLASRGQKRSVRTSIRVEFLENRELLSAIAGPENSILGQTAVPLAVGIPVNPPLAGPDTNGPAVSAPYSPTQIRQAYGISQLSSLNGAGQTIAIVDAYDDPTIASDLAYFDSYYGVPAANLQVVNQTGGTSLPGVDSTGGWEGEESLDVEWSHVIAPAAKIILVEANSASETDLLDGVSEAVALGAKQVSMSWGGGEYSGEASLESYFTPGNAPGVTFLASTGDSASAVEFPAIVPYVTSVGGTSISLDSAGDMLSDTVWSSGGGGQSQYISEPTFQQGFQSTGKRTTPDVAFDANPNTGVLIRDNGGWEQVGGTSVGAPMWGGIMALANQGRANLGESPVGSGLTYGTNTLLYQLAGGSTYTNTFGDFQDITSGSNGHAATTGYDEATGLGSPVANDLVRDVITPPSTNPPLGDPNFSEVPLPTGAFQYGPTGSAWTFTGTAGISANGSGFTAGNPNAPVGSQVGFIQETGSLSQSVLGWAPDTYTISFDAAQRGNIGTSLENFEVLIDGNVVGTFRPSGTSYLTYTTSAFTVTTGTHTIEFLGLDSVGGDNTALIDAVSIGVAVQPTTPTVGDPDFEDVPLTSGSFAYDPTGSSWSFSGSSGVSANGSAFTSGNPNAPVGNQVGFIQETGAFSQSVSGWLAGTYSLSFDAAQRGNYGTSLENFEVLIDGNVVGTINPSGTAYATYTTSAFTVAAGTHTIEFLGLDSVGGDNTALIDAVSIGVATPPTTPTVGDPDFENVPLTSGSFAYDPTGSPWSFAGTSGVSANGSAFTSGNPNAPVGNQVGLIQETGSFSQSVSGWTAGSYTISFDAAQRGNAGTSDEDFEILIDGNVVGTFNPSGTAYATYTTSAFTVTTGTHTIEFLGLDSVGGDNTALIDAVSIA